MRPISALILARLARSIELMVRGRTRTGRRSPLREEVTNLRAQLAAARQALAVQVAHKGSCCWIPTGHGCDCGSVDAVIRAAAPDA